VVVEFDDDDDDEELDVFRGEDASEELDCDCKFEKEYDLGGIGGASVEQNTHTHIETHSCICG
jgi:hypothetical protein